MPLNVALARENWDHYVYARDNGHLDFVRKAKLCEDYYYGSQWNPIHKARLERQGKPVLTINKVFSTLLTVMGEQLQNQASVNFVPTAAGDPKVADALNKLYIHIMQNNDMKHLESELFDEGAITSRGFLDIRLSFNDAMRGEVEVTALNSKNVIIDPDANSYDPDDWNELFITKWLSPNDIAVTYNQADADMLMHKSRTDFEYGIDSINSLENTFGGRGANRHVTGMGDPDKTNRRYIRVIERQFKKVRNVEHFVDLETGDMRPVPEDWKEERIAQVASKYKLGTFKKKIKQIKWLVTADNYVLHDKWSPYNHFTPVPYFPIFHKGKTIGLVENLISSQDFLNKTTSQELHVVNTTANSGWQMEEDQLTNMDPDELEARGAETGLVIVRKKGSQPLEKIQPNQIPTGLDRLSYKADEYLKELSGVSDSQRGFDRADVAAKAIQAKQAAGGVNQAKAFFNLARTRRIVAKRVLDLVQEFYTEERIIRVTGNRLDSQPEEVVLNQITPDGEIVNDLTLGEYEVTVVDAPAKDSFRESQFQEAKEMREMGVTIPDSVLIESSNLSNKEEIIDANKQLTGEADPSEMDQKMAQLELEIKQLEADELKVAIQQKQAEVGFTQAKTSKAANEAQNVGGDNSNVIEIEKFKADLLLKREEIQGDLALKREEMRRTNLLAAEKLEQEERLGEKKLAQDKDLAEQKIKSDASIAKAKPAPKAKAVK